VPRGSALIEVVAELAVELGSATVRKELVSLRTAWNWGVHMGLVTGRFPALKRVKMPKPEEKPHFQTRQEIERQIGSLDKKGIAELWDALYLTRPSRERNSEANMAFVRQNGWCLYQPIWGECHEFSMVVFGQVFQPHCLRFALL
jgi:hypothetical protein